MKAYMFLVNKIGKAKKHKVVFSSFGGKSYSDNPRAISEKLHQMYPSFEIVWLFKNPEAKEKAVPAYVRRVKIDSLQAYKELATAKIWVDNSPKRRVYKSKEQVYIQTWHGDRGFKKVLYDCRTLLLNGHYKEGDLFEERHCDLAVSGSQHGNKQYQTAFGYKGEILLVGSPRNDQLVENDRNLAKTIKKTLGINPETGILLYAPTFRKEASRNKTAQAVGSIDLFEVVNTLEARTNKQWICLTRAHSEVPGLSGIPNNESFMDVTPYEDMSDLLLISDLLLTDYSTSAGDFALLERPVILFQNDREEYLKKDRTFYFDIDQSPYLVAMNQAELIDIIKKIDPEAISQNCKAILDFYGTNETGKASEAVVSFMVTQLEA